MSNAKLVTLDTGGDMNFGEVSFPDTWVRVKARPCPACGGERGFAHFRDDAVSCGECGAMFIVDSFVMKPVVRKAFDALASLGIDTRRNPCKVPP
jgi:ribosomal protein S27AE